MLPAASRLTSGCHLSGSWSVHSATPSKVPMGVAASVGLTVAVLIGVRVGLTVAVLVEVGVGLTVAVLIGVRIGVLVTVAPAALRAPSPTNVGQSPHASIIMNCTVYALPGANGWICAER